MYKYILKNQNNTRKRIPDFFINEYSEKKKIMDKDKIVELKYRNFFPQKINIYFIFFFIIFFLG